MQFKRVCLQTLRLMFPASMALLLACGPRAVHAEDSLATALPKPSSLDDQTEHKRPSEFDIPLEINADAAKALTTVPVHINLSIPHHSTNTVTTCGAYPYPTQPQKKRGQLRPLDTNVRSLKMLVQQTAYTRKHIRVVAYPGGGWRWQNAYARAKERSGQIEPFLLTNMYLFTNALVPYVHEEVKKINDFEQQREERYKQAVEDFKEERGDAETEATRKGLYALNVKFKKFFANGDRQGTVNLAPGQWWIVCSHKVPGLTYYWQQPVTVHENEPTVVTLTEDNALLIEGAW